MRKTTIANPPRHIALIPDGNRRWAKANGKRLLQAYDFGIKRFIDFAGWSKDLGIRTITVWALSTENLRNRSALELKVLFALYTKAANDKNLRKMLNENGIKLKIVGDIAALPEKLRTSLLDIENKTAEFSNYTINLLINYGGKEDLVYSAQEIARSKASKIDEAVVKDHLRTSDIPDVDLIIRTSGEHRLSGLLPWQTAYSELYFAKKYWPDFKRADLKKAVEDYSQRQRRFGK